MHLTAAEIAAAAGGEVVAGDPASLATSFAIDSRLVEPGACFAALRGHRDGHDFVGAAFAAGAAAALVARVPGAPVPAPTAPGTSGAAGTTGALVRVDDPLAALGRLAAATRAGALAGATVVGVTGSTGKTSTKDLLAAALGRTREVHASPDSFNNEAGLPLTLLGADRRTEILVAEMGARFAGNIADLCRIARPDVGVVTNVGLAHAEHLGGPAGILAVKAELLEALPATGLAVLNADDPRSAGLAGRTAARVVRAGSAPDADVRVTGVRLDASLRPELVLDSPWGRVEARLRVRGEHQVANAALAAAVALVLGVAPEEVGLGLGEAEGSRWRLQLERSPGGVAVLNDAYNANPASMEAALRSLARFEAAGRRVAVLGEMRELGEHAAAAHAQVGRLAGRLGLDAVVVVGDLGALGPAAAEGVPEVRHAADARAALDAVVEIVAPGDAVLVKASRAVGLEQVAGALVEGAADGAPARAATVRREAAP